MDRNLLFLSFQLIINQQEVANHVQILSNHDSFPSIIVIWVVQLVRVVWADIKLVAADPYDDELFHLEVCTKNSSIHIKVWYPNQIQYVGYFNYNRSLKMMTLIPQLNDHILLSYGDPTPS